MTREDAVKVLNAIWKYKHCGFSEKKIREALDMAIEALEQEPCEDDKNKALNSAMFIRGLYNGLRICRPNYNASDYKWLIGKAVMNEFEEQQNNKYRLLPIFEYTATLYGIKVEVDNINRYDIKLYENITNKIDVEKDKNATRYDEAIKMLTMLKKQARYMDHNTLIEDVRLSSFNWVIDKEIKLLEAESEEK